MAGFSFLPEPQMVKDFLSYASLMMRGNRFSEDIGKGEIYPRPVLLIHGFLGTRAVMLPLEKFLKDYGPDVFSITLGVVNSQDIRVSAFKIHRAIERLCYDLDIQEIDIVAHSMGGLIGLYYIKKLGGSARVRKLITLGTPYVGTRAAWLAVAMMGPMAPASWQMTPDSFFLKELHTGPIPPDVEVYAIEARKDTLVPASAEHVEGIKSVKVDFGHASLIFSEEVHRLIKEILTMPTDAENEPRFTPET